MTDKEILELAAKDAGIKLMYWNDGKEPYSSGEGFVLESNKLWNSLSDSADAFSLKASLMINVDYIFLPHVIYVRAYNGSAPAVQVTLYDERTRIRIDREAAERRVITVYAAETGKYMK